MADESVSIRGVYNLTNPKRVQMLVDGGLVPPGPGPTPVAPAFTTQPSLTGSTALGNTITVSLGAASGIPAPALTGTLTRPGKAAADVLDGATFTVEAADQGGTITLDVTATNSAGSETAVAALSVPAAPVVTPPATPAIVQQAAGHATSGSNSTTPTTVTLAAPATAGNALVLFAMSDKISGAHIVPAGFEPVASHVTGSGVSGTVFTKVAEGGEATFEVRCTNTGTVWTSAWMVETTPAVVDQSALGLTNVSTVSRGSSAQVDALANTLALASWHNDSASNSQFAGGSGFGAGWTIADGSGVGPVDQYGFPVKSTDAGAPGWMSATRSVAADGPLTAAFALGTSGTTADENMVMLVTLKGATGGGSTPGGPTGFATLTDPSGNTLTDNDGNDLVVPV